MGAFDNSVQVTITLAGKSVPSAGFSVPLLAGAAAFAERVRTYTTVAGINTDETAGDISALIADGLRAALEQTIHVPSVKMGRVEPDVAQVDTVLYTGGVAVALDTHTISINGVLYTTPAAAGGETPAAIAALIAPLVNADPNVSAVDSGAGLVTITALVAGTPFTTGNSNTGSAAVTGALVLLTTNTSIFTELDLIVAADSDWYGLALESRAALQITRAADWTQGNARLFIGQSSDADLLTVVTTDVASTLEGLGFTRTAIAYHSNDLEWVAMAVLGFKLAANPDVISTMWAYVTLVGVTPNSLSDTEITNAFAKNVNLYHRFLSVPAWRDGVLVDGTFLDLQVTVDWMSTRIREGNANALLAASNRNDKIPYNDSGISTFVEVIRDVFRIGVNAKHFNDGTLILDPPKRADIPAVDINARLLNLEFQAEASGAIQNTTILGFVVVDL